MVTKIAKEFYKNSFQANHTDVNVSLFSMVLVIYWQGWYSILKSFVAYICFNYQQTRYIRGEK